MRPARPAPAAPPKAPTTGPPHTQPAAAPPPQAPRPVRPQEAEVVAARTGAGSGEQVHARRCAGCAAMAEKFDTLEGTWRRLWRTSGSSALSLATSSPAARPGSTRSCEWHAGGACLQAGWEPGSGREPLPAPTLARRTVPPGPGCARGRSALPPSRLALAGTFPAG